MQPSNCKLSASGHHADALPLFGMQITPLSMAQTVDAVLDMASRPRTGCLRYVVTPNVDHVVRFEDNLQLRAAYAEASLVVADGKPVVMAARWLGVSLPSTVPGSDLVPALFDEACARRKPLRVFLFGAAPGVADDAADKIVSTWGAMVTVVGCVSPEFGFDSDPKLSSHYARAIAEVDPDVLLIGLGMPKQEAFAWRHRNDINAGVALCIGATLDFLAGNKSRAPKWVRHIGMEWFHRMCQEPGRLVRRYAYDAWMFPRIVAREYIRKRHS